MDLGADGGTRLASALAAAGDVARAVEESGGEYVVYDFAAGHRPWGPRLPRERVLTAEDVAGRNSSDAAGALSGLVRFYGREGLAAAVVLSDGAWGRAPGGPSLPPCYTLAPAGGPPENAVIITDVRVPAVVLPGTTFEGRVSYLSTYADGGRVAATVEEEGGASAEYEFSVSAGRGEAVINAVVGEAGDQFFRAAVSSGPGETWFHVRALERPLRVWYREMAGDADFAFIRRALESNAGFDLTYRLDVGDRALGTAAGAADGTDVVILGNPRAGEITPAEGAALEAHVARGGGLLVVVSARPVDASALASGPLAGLLPVRVGANVEEAPGGPLKEASYPGAAGVAATPPVATHVWRLGSLKEAASPVWLGPDGTPALVTMPYGLGRVAVLAAGGFYRNHLATGGDALQKFTAALALAGYDEQAEPLAVGRRVAGPGDVVEVVCRGVGEPTVVCVGPGGGVKRVALSPAAGGLWVGDVEIGEPGRYEITGRIPTAEGVEVLKRAVLSRPSSSEYRAVNVDGDALRALAASTGGRYFEPGDAAGLAGAVAERVREAPQVPVPLSRAIWPPWLAFPAALALLAADWVIRRRSGLS
jgi:hypothetical protein